MNRLVRFVLTSGIVVACCDPLARQPASVPGRRRPAPIVYVALGDSATKGTGTGEPVRYSYPALLARYLPRGSRFLNLGGDGSGLDGALSGQLPRALAAHPTLVTMWLGWVDLVGERASPVAYGARLDRMLGAFQRIHAHVFLGNLPDMRLVPVTNGGGAAYAAGARAYNAVIQRAARRHGATVVNIYAATRLLWPHPELQQNDDLNTRGYTVLARIWYRVMHSQHAL